MSLISIKNLTFGYEGSYDNIFENVNITLDTDWKLGLVGRNGRGKTTLLNLLMGRYEYQGSISSSVGFDYFPFAVEDKSRETWEIADAVSGEAEQWQLMRELNKLEADEGLLYQPFETLSGGEQTKVLLAALFLKEGRFLLIDEPTNHLDSHARRVLSRYLDSKKGYILVSHDRDFIDGCIDHVLSINRANIEVQKGNFSSWQQNRLWADNHEMEQNERLKKDIRRLKETAERTERWSDKVEKSKKGERVAGLRPDRGHIGAQAAKMMKRSKSAETRVHNAIDQKASLLKNVEQTDELFFRPLEYKSPIVAEAEGLSLSYDGRTIFRDIGFQLRRGDRLAISGKNGSGKSSILKMLVGQEIPYTGNLRVGSGVVISYVPQDTSFLHGSLNEFVDASGVDKSLLLTLLRKLDFARVQFEKDIADFSEGQKKKVLIAKSLCESAHLYIWDEPLNFIDVLSRLQVEDAIVKSRPTMVFVEHDTAFIRNIATGVVDLNTDFE